MKDQERSWLGIGQIYVGKGRGDKLDLAKGLVHFAQKADRLQKEIKARDETIEECMGIINEQNARIDRGTGISNKGFGK